MERLYEFKIVNKNGTSSSTTIPCKDYLEALRVKDEILRKASINCVDVVPVGENINFEMPKLEKGKYPIIKVPASGKPDWYNGARTMCFVYSRNHGNFILEGYRREVDEYLKKNYTLYFCYISMWSNGKSRGHWDFWKDSIGIFEPSKERKDWKWEIRPYSGGRSNLSSAEINKKTFRFKRLPKRWIPEFNKL
jgi:hypothetical protein